MRLELISLGTIAIMASPAAAQMPYQGCLDREDRPIRGVVDNTIPYAGVATVAGDGTPIIYYNSKSLSRATPVARRFVYLHECGHHQLRHVWKNPSRRGEMEADCWAVQRMVEQEIIKPRHIDDLQAEIGSARGIGSLKGCVTVKTDPELWHKSLDLLNLAGAHAFQPIRGAPIVEASERGFFESTLDLPGVFDCELTPEESFSCEIFNGQSEKAVKKHYEVVRQIIEGWISSEEWLTFERWRARPTELRRFVAQEVNSGALMTLVATAQYDILFRYQPSSD